MTRRSCISMLSSCATYVSAAAMVFAVAVAAFTPRPVVAQSSTSSAPTPPPIIYQEPFEDLRVKVLGGNVVIHRTFAENRWHPNYNWARLKITFDSADGSAKTIQRGRAEYTKTAPGVFAYRKRHTIRQTPTGFRWSDRDGNWIDYDDKGVITAYGDRNDVQVKFETEAVTSGGVLSSVTTYRITGVFDHLDRQVLWFEYTGDNLTGIRDYTNRRVEYQYGTGGGVFSGSTVLKTVIDANGHSWNYEYTLGVPTKFIDPEGRVVIRAWAGNGSLASLRYSDGVGTDNKYEYDSTKEIFYSQEKTTGGRVTESWVNKDGYEIRYDLNGQTIRALAIDSSSRTRTTTDARDLKTVREYDQWDNLVKITYPDGTTASTTYDPIFSNPTQKIDERGTITRYEYDSRGNLTRVTEAVGRPEQRVTEYTYDEYGNRLTETKRGGTVTLPGGGTVIIPDATITFEYDISGNVTALIDPESNRTEGSDHDAIGNPRTIRDARQKVWTRTYDNRGMLTSEANPLGHTNRIEYDRAGLRVRTIDAVNNPTVYAYDPRGNLVTVTDPFGGIVRIDYDAQNQPTAVTDQEGKQGRQDYDLDGRLVSQVDGNGNVIQYVYGDSASGLDNLLIKTVYPTYSQEYKYDSRGRVVETVDLLDATNRLSSKSVYDAAGNRTAITDKENKTTSYVYDALGRLVSETDPGAGVTTYTYDPRNNLIALTDAKNQAHRFNYDRKNLNTREIRPLGQAIAYTYTATGQLESITDPKGQVKRYSYDDGERLTGEAHYLTAGAATPAKSITYSYNSLGALTGYNDGTTQGSASYDVRQLRKIGETINYGTFSLSYSYDYYANGLKKSFTGPDGVTVNYTYDTNNQLSAIQLPIGNLTRNTYQWYWPTLTTLPGGTTRAQAYDPLMRLTAINVKDPAQNQVLNYQYAYDKADNITQKATEHGTYDYTYDNLYRLTGATNPSPLVGETYTYDPVGNRLSDSNIIGPWQYNTNNELTEAGAEITFTYDANGNTVTKTEGANVTNYVWDTFDRLTEVRDGSNNLIASYAYDPFGRRLWKEVGTTRTYFFYAEEGLIAEANNTGTVTTLFGYQPNGTWGTDPIYLKLGSNYYFYENDHLGTSQKLVAQNGTVVWNATAQVFGQTIVDAASTITNHLRFPGQYYDQETGGHYNYFRYYDPSTGRYITSDPIGLNGGMNTYLYGEGNPLRYTDPYGLFSAADLPALPQGFVNFSAGLGDVLLLGQGQRLRDLAGVDGGVDRCSDAYRYGGYTGTAALAATGGYGIARMGAGRFLYDARRFSTISRAYWGARGGAGGMSLDHLYLSQAAIRSGAVSGGIANGGWNLLVMPASLNRWLGFAPNWGGIQGLMAEATRAAIQVGVPSMAAASGYAGYQIGTQMNETRCGCQ